MRALPARRAAARARSRPRARPPRRCAPWSPRARTRRRRSAPRSPPRSTAATVLREGVEDRDDNETRFVWLARAADAEHASPPLRAAGGEPRSLARLLGSRRRATPAGSCAAWTSSPARDQPDEDRVAPAARAARRLHVLRRPRRRRARGAGRGRARGLRELCEHVRVLGSYPAALPAPAGAAVLSAGGTGVPAAACGAAPATLRR